MSLKHLYDTDIQEPELYPICPVCGAECEKIIYSTQGDIVGCDECIKEVDAWEWMAEEYELKDGYLDYLADLEWDRIEERRLKVG